MKTDKYIPYFIQFAIRASLLCLFVFVSIHAQAQFIDKQKATVYAWLEKASELYLSDKTDWATQQVEQAYAYAKENRRSDLEIDCLLKRAKLSEESGTAIELENSWKKAESIIIHTRDTSRMAELKLQIARYKLNNGNFTEAITNYNTALHIRYEKRQNDTTAVIYNDLGNVFMQKGEYDQSIAWYIKSLKIWERLKAEDEIANTYGNMANLYFHMGENEKAVAYAKRSISVRERLNDDDGLAIVNGNLSRMYVKMEQLDSAIIYQKQAQAYAEKTGKKKNVMQGLVNLALIYRSQGNYAMALKHMQDAMEMGKTWNEPGLPDYTRMAAIFAGRTGDTTLMNRYYDESFALAKSAGKSTTIRDIYASKKHYYENSGDYKRALENTHQYHKYKDSIFDLASKDRVAELEIAYETEKKDAEIIRLAREKLISQLEIDKKNALLRVNLAESEKQKQHIDLLAQNEKMHLLQLKQQEEELELASARVRISEQNRLLAENEKDLQQQQLRNITYRRNMLIAAIGAGILWVLFLFNRYRLKKQIEHKNMLLGERNRISSELHDEVGSTLSAIHILSHSALAGLEKNPQRSGKQLENIRHNAQQMMESMGDIVWSIHPGNDSMDRIAARMKEFAAQVLDAKNIGYQFTVDETLFPIKLTPEKRRDLYLIFKEALNNSAKYAEANQLRISLRKVGQFIELTINDNGKGFDLNAENSGNGLRNMQERAVRNEAELRIESNIGNGCSVNLRMKYT